MLNRFLLVISCIVLGHTYGQKLANSPYTYNALGEYGTLDNATFVGVGNAYTGISDSLTLNYFNPSSYCFLGKGQPLFSSGVSYKNSYLTENSVSTSSNMVSANHFAFGVPFGKRLGLAFGIKPFTRMGYEIHDKQILGTDTMLYSYSGSGSINDAFLGFSAKVLNLKKHQFALGANFSYLFGTVTNYRTANLSNALTGSLEEQKYRTKSIYLNYGLTYKFKISKNQDFSLGFTYAPSQKINTSKNLDLISMDDVSNLSSDYRLDTISSFAETSSIQFPSIMDIGFAYSFRPKVDSSYNKTKVFQLNFYGSYQAQNWSEYHSNFSNDSALTLLNTSKMSFGFEFTPHYNYLDRTKNISYLNRMRYRAGFQYGTMPIVKNNLQLIYSSVSLGVSLPISIQRSVSSLNFGFTYGNRGNNDGISLNERYFGVNFGVSIAPGLADRWFRKYKID